MRIADRSVGSDAATFVIAEAGSNHDGKLAEAKRLVDAAADAGADAVKFQTFRADRMYVDDSGTVETSNGERELTDVVAEAEMPYGWIPELAEYCDRRGIYFMSSPFDARSADELDEYVPAYKIASSVLTHYPLIEHLARSGKPLIASTGAHELTEIEQAVATMRSVNESVSIVLLHCVSSYPTPLEDSNVSAVERLAEEFDLPVGLSDHTVEPTIAPCAAVALGADIIEKHLTLDSSREGLDHSFALEPDEFEEMVSHVRDTRRALGTSEVTVRSVEAEWYESARRTIQATSALESGETVSEDDIGLLRSGERSRGLEPAHLEAVIGATAIGKIEKDSGIRWSDIDVEPPNHADE